MLSVPQFIQYLKGRGQCKQSQLQTFKNLFKRNYIVAREQKYDEHGGHFNHHRK